MREREREKSYKMAWETIVWKLVSLACYFVTELEDRNANHRRQYCYLWIGNKREETSENEIETAIKSNRRRFIVSTIVFRGSVWYRIRDLFSGIVEKSSTNSTWSFWNETNLKIFLLSWILSFVYYYFEIL